MLAALWSAILDWLLKRDPNRDPIIDGYNGVTDAQSELIGTLTERLDAAEQRIEKSERRLKRCERRHWRRDQVDRKRKLEMDDLRQKVDECGKEHQGTQAQIAAIEEKIG